MKIVRHYKLSTLCDHIEPHSSREAYKAELGHFLDVVQGEVSLEVFVIMMMKMKKMMKMIKMVKMVKMVKMMKMMKTMKMMKMMKAMKMMKMMRGEYSRLC